MGPGKTCRYLRSLNRDGRVRFRAARHPGDALVDRLEVLPRCLQDIAHKICCGGVSGDDRLEFHGLPLDQGFHVGKLNQRRTHTVRVHLCGHRNLR